MKITKRLLVLLIFILSLSLFMPTNVSASVELVSLQKTDGTGSVTYRNSMYEVKIPTTYVKPNTEFRGVWVTPLTGDIARFSSEEQYKKEMTEVFDVMKMFNMNAIVYHVRIMNDALYESELNPWSVYYNTNPSWEALPWLIEEAHKRGIEFHAWMNPYRVTNSYSGTVEQYAETVPDYNIASDPNNLLKDSSTHIILNPGEPAVRDFLIETVMEVVNKYDVDAIHFDDYFYISDIDDSKTKNKYDNQSMPLDDWRRLQVDLFIEALHNEIESFNQQNIDRRVQLGISPSGIWNNGDGVVEYDANGNAITNGSNTNGFFHYGDYLYSDTKKWIDNEWIDYIIPQSYWAFEHPQAGFADVMDWWVKVVKNKDVNLYSGMGLYLAGAAGSTYSWYNNPNEAYNQVLYLSKYEDVNGICIFSYKHIESAAVNMSSVHFKNMNPVRTNMWNSPAILPEVQTPYKINLGKIQGLTMESTNRSRTLTWDSLDAAKYYVIYRSKEAITYDATEVFDIIGADNANETTSYTDNSYGKDFNYAIKPMSVSNTLGDGVSITKDGIKDFLTVTFYDFDGNEVKTELVPNGESVTPPTLKSIIGHSFKGWTEELSNVTSDLEVHPIYEANTYNIVFKDFYYSIIKTEIVAYGNSATAPEPPKLKGYHFVKWDKDFSKITGDLEVKAIYEPHTSECIMTVIFKDFEGNILETKEVNYGNSVESPTAPEVEGYVFLKWDTDLTEVLDDIEVKPIYKELKNFTVIFKDKLGNVIKTETVAEGNSATAPLPPEVEGYQFKEWDQAFNNVDKNLVVIAVYEETSYTVVFVDDNGNIIKEVEVKHGENVESPTPPTKDGYKFKNWDKDFTNVTEDLTITAVYDKVATKSCSLFNFWEVLSVSVFVLGFFIFRKKH